MNGAWLERSGIALGFYFFARMMGRYRGAKKQQEALKTPLVDAALLEAVFQPRPKDGDDPDLLAEMRDTLAHLNRQAYAEEFWGLSAQIAALDSTLGGPQKATLRRALLRLLASNDRWLQMIGAKTAAALHLGEAIPPIRALLETDGEAEGSADEAVTLRFQQALEEALATLTG